MSAACLAALAEAMAANPSLGSLSRCSPKPAPAAAPEAQSHRVGARCSSTIGCTPPTKAPTPARNGSFERSLSEANLADGPRLSTPPRAVAPGCCWASSRSSCSHRAAAGADIALSARCSPHFASAAIPPPAISALTPPMSGAKSPVGAANSVAKGPTAPAVVVKAAPGATSPANVRPKAPRKLVFSGGNCFRSSASICSMDIPSGNSTGPTPSTWIV